MLFRSRHFIKVSYADMGSVCQFVAMAQCCCRLRSTDRTLSCHLGREIAPGRCEAATVGEVRADRLGEVELTNDIADGTNC